MKSLLLAVGALLISSTVAKAQSYVQTYQPVFVPAPTITHYGPAPGDATPQPTPAYYRGITAPVTAYYTPGSFFDRAAIPMNTAYVRESTVYRPGAVYRNGTFLTWPGFYQPVYNVRPSTNGPNW